MKNVLIGLIITVAILAIAATIFVSKLDELIADAIRTEGTATIGTKVDVASVQTKLKDGVAIISGLSIANPSGYKNTNALSIDTFTADVDYGTQVVEKIIIDKPSINAEIIDLKKNNFQDLLDGMPETVDDETDAADDDEQLFTIKSFQLKSAQVNVLNDKLGERSFVMKNLTISNLSGTVEQISDEIIRRLTSHVSAQVKNYAKQELGKLLKDQAKKQLKEEASEQINRALNEKVTDKLKDLKGFKLNLK